MGEFRLLLGDHILAANASLAGAGEVKLRLLEKIVETPRRAGLGWPAELSRYAGNGTVKIPVRLLALGDTVLWGAPVELFCEIAIRVRNDSPFRHTLFSATLTAGWAICPRRQPLPKAGMSRAPRCLPIEWSVISPMR